MVCKKKSLRYHQSAGQKGKDGSELTFNQVEKLEDQTQTSKYSSNAKSRFFIRESIAVR